MEEKQLTVYVIEDDFSRIDKMKGYFLQVNKEIERVRKIRKSEEVKSASDVGHNGLINFLDSLGYTIINFQVIQTSKTSQDNERKYYEYEVADDADYIIKIRHILEEEEDRLFFLDLALNQKEREIFSKNQEMLRPYNARKIMEELGKSKRKELVILNSRFKNLGDVWRRLLNVEPGMYENLQVKQMEANYFSPTYGSLMTGEILLEKIEDYLKNLSKRREEKENGGV